jgi:hypothetical protein
MVELLLVVRLRSRRGGGVDIVIDSDSHFLEKYRVTGTSASIGCDTPASARDEIFRDDLTSPHRLLHDMPG